MLSEQPQPLNFNTERGRKVLELISELMKRNSFEEVTIKWFEDVKDDLTQAQIYPAAVFVPLITKLYDSTNQTGMFQLLQRDILRLAASLGVEIDENSQSNILEQAISGIANKIVEMMISND